MTALELKEFCKKQNLTYKELGKMIGRDLKIIL